ncbi:Flippase [Moraxellaceae bacterium 17A]|nr:Flippase [Moraxellaceae bacterium 17A]
MNLGRLSKVLVNNRKVVENYLFMTILQILNSFFYLLIYPYVIRVLGIEGYGQFVFAMSIATYFVFFINFGFDLLATKFVAENITMHDELEEILSIIFTSKNLLFLSSTLIFTILLITIPFLNENKTIFIISFLSSYATILFPQWFFQGLQNMRSITLIQLSIKLISLPMIFFLVQSKNDLITYTCIFTGSSLISGLIVHFFLRFKYRLKIKIVSLTKIKIWYQASLPFFYSSLAGIIKENSIPIIIGSFFGMKEVAIYDLANKLIIVPRTLLSSVNAAIYPKLITIIDNNLVKKIIKLEAIVSWLVIAAVIVFGKFIVILMGSMQMIKSYYLAIFLSFTILSWLVVGAYINFVFIPNNKNYLIAKNQFLAMSSFFIVCFIGLFYHKDLMILGFALAISGLIELLYCYYVTKRDSLL